jgi:hypothetical protein
MTNGYHQLGIEISFPSPRQVAFQGLRDPSSRRPCSFAWDLSVPSYHMLPRGGNYIGLAVERLYTGRERLTHSALLFTFLLASGAESET